MKTDMMKPISWQRLEYQGRPIYVQPEKPDWAAANPESDRLINALLETGDIHRAARLLEAEGRHAQNLLALERLASQLFRDPPPPYHGRHRALSLGGIKECWFHLTDRCNLACRHCLFASSPASAATLPRGLLDSALAQAKASGCKLFYFTGGEPFVYPDFMDVVAAILTDPQTHVVVLSNGMSVKEHLKQMRGLPQNRLHLQISMDGLKPAHETQRGAGTWERLLENLSLLTASDIPVTLCVAVNRTNLTDLDGIIGIAHEAGINNIHFLWHFIRGKGTAAQFVPPADILPHLFKAAETAEAKNILIDNIESIRSQVFATPGTRFDLSNTGWESLTVGPDGGIYPSPALVGIPELFCGHLDQGLETVWQQSPVLQEIRRASLIDSPTYLENPLRFIIGGGDIDHSFLAGGAFVGHDPYVELYNHIALWLIDRQAAGYDHRSPSDLVLRMGDVRCDCPDGKEVSLTHCNCVISLADDLGHHAVREFYANAAVSANADIVNPFAPDPAAADFIPHAARQRSYGCGSPVNDADPQPGETLVDLGSGSGVECFMAAARVGETGRIYGIDMTDEMLHLARASLDEVTRNLGYENIDFKKGFLENIPLPDQTADAVISNCVINLSPDKRLTFQEIFRVLKPGGRLVVSDIVTDDPIPVAIKNNEQYRGECLGGAMTQEDLMAMLRSAGFTGASLVKRFFYRQEGNTRFFSLTFRAYKPGPTQEVDLVYRGPFAALATEAGDLLIKGKRIRLPLLEAHGLDESVLVFNAAGEVANIAMTGSCCGAATEPTPLKQDFADGKTDGGCCPTDEPGPVSSTVIALPGQPAADGSPHAAGCMACGGMIIYLSREDLKTCHYCGAAKKTQTICVHGHYICDDCHQQQGLSAIRLICTQTKETDLLNLLCEIRRHPAVPMHGPEHHAIVPGIILAAYRNLGGDIGKEAILTGIDRGSKVPGGVCGFWGSCGAAIGVGIAFSVLLGATPLSAHARQNVQTIVSEVLAEIAAINGPRCCQRESYIALTAAAKISRRFLTIPLNADRLFTCSQCDNNKECIRGRCPVWYGEEAFSASKGSSDNPDKGKDEHAPHLQKLPSK
jgi:7,8-dihydro-6-hydroxymethylpterin dimethyltransferase